MSIELYDALFNHWFLIIVLQIRLFVGCNINIFYYWASNVLLFIFDQEQVSSFCVSLKIQIFDI